MVGTYGPEVVPINFKLDRRIQLDTEDKCLHSMIRGALLLDISKKHAALTALKPTTERTRFRMK